MNFDIESIKNKKIFLLKFGNSYEYNINHPIRSIGRYWNLLQCWKFSKKRYIELLIKLPLINLASPDIFSYNIDVKRPGDFKIASNNIKHLLSYENNNVQFLDINSDLNPRLYNPYDKGLDLENIPIYNYCQLFAIYKSDNNITKSIVKEMFSKMKNKENLEPLFLVYFKRVR